MSAFSWDTSSVRNYFVLAISLACVIRMSVCPVLVTSRTLPYFWLNIRPPAHSSLLQYAWDRTWIVCPDNQGTYAMLHLQRHLNVRKCQYLRLGKLRECQEKMSANCALSKMIPSQILLASSQGHLSHALALPPSRQS